MKRLVAVIASLLCTTAVAQTVAPGPYYATPSWDQQLAASSRFVALSNWGNGLQAVLDRETGLVWERRPNTREESWQDASRLCLEAFTGGRGGWKLPTVQELMSLFLIGPADALPAGHPFDGSLALAFWTSTQSKSLSSSAYLVRRFPGSVSVSAGDRALPLAAPWCVRGGPGPDEQ
jgi:hypothetical protein